LYWKMKIECWLITTQVQHGHWMLADHCTGTTWALNAGWSLYRYNMDIERWLITAQVQHGHW